MNSINKFIEKNKWIVPFYLFALIYVVFQLILMIYDFKLNKEVTFLIQPLIFLSILALAIYFMKSDKVILLFFVSFSMWFLVECILYKVSPYKSYLEQNGNIFYKIHEEQEEFIHSRIPHQTIVHKQKEFETNFKINHRGFRGDLIEDSMKIILIGDSFIEGWGLSNDSTINILLERQIGCNYCVMNAGVSGSEVISAFKFLKEFLKENIQPQLVILNINSTDFTDLYLSNKTDSKPNTFLKAIYGSSFIFRHVYNILSIDKKYGFNIKQTYVKNEEVLPLFQDVFIEYQNLLSSKNISFFVILQPVENELTQAKEEAILFNLEKILIELDISHYNAHNDFKNHLNYSELFWPVDGHFNNKGAQFFAENIYHELLNMHITYLH